MALFGKKKEEKLKEIPIPEELKPHLELRQDEIPIPEELKPHLELRQDQESQFTSPEDLMKITTEQMSPNLAQTESSLQNVQEIKPATQMPPVKAESPQVNFLPVAKQETSKFAPLFVAIDRYRNILKALGEIKTTLALMKNAFVMLNEIDKIEDENMNLIASTLDKIEKKMIALDAEFLRPYGFEDEMSETYEFENVQSVISGLHSQIDKLKTDMQQVQ